MIVKRNFSLRKIWGYIKSQVLFIALWSTLVWGVYYFTGYRQLAINFTPIGVLGSVLAIFVIMERTGAANEDPFKNRITDVPLTALCNTIERDLRELLGERALPERTPVTDGYLV